MGKKTLKIIRKSERKTYLIQIAIGVPFDENDTFYFTSILIKARGTLLSKSTTSPSLQKLSIFSKIFFVFSINTVLSPAPSLISLSLSLVVIIAKSQTSLIFRPILL